MRKQLDGFIEENRRAFDDELPGDAVWDQIEKRIEHARPRRLLPMWRQIAAIFIGLLLLAAGGWWLMNGRSKKEPEITQAPAGQQGLPTEQDLAGFGPEYAAYARKVSAMIGERRQLLKQETARQPELYEQFAQDLASLDSAYRILKQQSLQTVNREVILRAMMQNLQLQAELLNKQLEILNDYPVKKMNSHDKENSRSL